jgi:hypothetical protein
MTKAVVEATDSILSHRKNKCDRPSTWRVCIGDAVVRTFIKNGFKLISRLDRDIGILIDNCLGFLYSVDLRQDMRRDLGKIEGALYDMVYLGRTPAGCEFKEDLFRTRILPIMKRIAPEGYYFGIDPENTGLLGYWQQSDARSEFDTHDLPGVADGGQVARTGTATAD